MVDDLTREAGEPGTAGLFDTELTSGLYYSYIVVDLPTLRRNLLGGKETLAATVVKHLVHLIATVSPGAKLGSTAPYGYAELMLVETGGRQPRSLANAFRKPVEPTIEAATAAHLERIDKAHGAAEQRQHLSIAGEALPGSTDPAGLDELADFAAAAAAPVST